MIWGVRSYQCSRPWGQVCENSWSCSFFVQWQQINLDKQITLIVNFMMEIAQTHDSLNLLHPSATEWGIPAVADFLNQSTSSCDWVHWATLQLVYSGLSTESWSELTKGCLYYQIPSRAKAGGRSWSTNLSMWQTSAAVLDVAQDWSGWRCGRECIDGLCRSCWCSMRCIQTMTCCHFISKYVRSIVH